MTAHVVVIGAGVTGLSAASRLQDAGLRVTVVARDFPTPSETIDARASINYASPWGGAHNRWVVPPPTTTTTNTDTAARVLARDHAFALETYAHMDALSRARPEAGVTFMPGIEYLEDPGRFEGEGNHLLTEARARELGVEGFRLLDASELPRGVRWGCSYRTWCVNPMVYLAFLLRRLARRGAALVRREVRGPDEAWALGAELGAEVDVVVNCSGVGFGDADVFITRGQTCLVSNSCDATVTRQNADGTWTFCVPRNFDGGTIVGGTKQPDDWDPEPSPAVREQLLARFAATYPAILAGAAGGSGRLEPLADIVGRRPTRRGGMRLELETLPPGPPGGGRGTGTGRVRHVVHAYGLGGRGYELSWGVAGRVAELVTSRDKAGSEHAKL
ncbi:hypothetical protein GGTG_07794 [Gaeumannomyces tritici R3-111a-1]|uniref:FAD dependent oxidoreductase domain-containing protein n=1 Tax=Gaeumannomyces tritici (strain R3-111a-1) TaxID=644352 RepID=J3P2P9_GAET3|nr:hypothetical protein GGTG_07794 [Gaeumannomyces tritici R3-111a-1]EJT73941.1 hypothetical protein GGTG_07794 [Gaeumannomyces tritici R3-111a-1]